MKLHYILRASITLTLPFLISACGGGGTSSSTPSSAGTNFSSTPQLATPTGQWKNLTNDRASVRATTSNAAGCFTLSPQTITGGTWYFAVPFQFQNTCPSPQSLSGLQFQLSATSGAMDSNGTLGSMSINGSYLPIQPTLTSTIVNGNLQLTLATDLDVPVGGTVTGSFGINNNIAANYSGLQLQIIGATPTEFGTLTTTIDSSALKSTCTGSTQCNIPIMLTGQNGTFNKTVYTITNSNIGNSNISLNGLMPGDYTLAASSLPQNVNVNINPQLIQVSADTQTSATVNFTVTPIQTGSISFGLTNPNPTLFTMTQVPVHLSDSQGHNSQVEVNFGTNQSANLPVGSYIAYTNGLGDALQGIYYNPVRESATISTGAEYALGNLTYASNDDAQSTTNLSIEGVDAGDSVTVTLTDSHLNGNVYTINPIALTSNSNESIATALKLLTGDTITINIQVSSKYNTPAPQTFTVATGTNSTVISITKPSTPVTYKLLSGYVDLTGIGGVAAATANKGQQQYNMIVLGEFAANDPNSATIPTGYYDVVSGILKDENPNTINLISIGGENVSPGAFADAATVASNMISQVNEYNAKLKAAGIEQTIAGVDLDLENGFTQSFITTLAQTIHNAGLAVSIAPQFVTLGGTINPVSPGQNVGFSSGGSANQYGQAISLGYVDYIQLQVYNQGQDVFIDGTTSTQVTSYSLFNQTINSMRSESCGTNEFCVPNRTIVLLGLPVNSGAAGTSIWGIGTNSSTSVYNSTLSNFVAEIADLMSGANGSGNFNGLMTWSLNNDYYSGFYTAAGASTPGQTSQALKQALGTQ